MKNVRHLLAGFAIGVIFAVVPSCGTSGKCSPSNCSTGCCDAQGQCQLGNSNGACGQLGGTCAVCQIAQACNLGTCMQGNPNGGGTGQGGGGGSNGGGTGGSNGGGTGGSMGGGTGGGSMGGGTGGSMGGGTGGGSTCDGCFSGGTCFNRLNTNNDTLCGQGGVQCATCTGTNHCVNYVCTSGTGGGGGTPTGGGTGGGTPTGGGTGGGTPTGGGGGTTGQPIGGACTSTANCQSGLFCKTTTVRGDATYPGGYCTKACSTQTDCGAPNDCVGGAQSTLQFYGEPNSFCVSACAAAGTQSTCRSGYQCEFAANGAPGLCWLNPIPPFSAGGQATNSGQPCTVDSCQPSNVNQLLSFCYKATLPDGGFSGWTGGNCSADCSYDNTGTFCGANATCVPMGTPPNDYMACLGTCATAGTRSTCRAGYSCFGLRGADGGASGTNICYPDCTITGCQAGTCNTTSGQCM